MLNDQRNAYARTLSGGMRRKLLIAKALVHDPEIIILDEPTAGVDIEIRTSVWNYIKKISKFRKIQVILIKVSCLILNNLKE